MRISGPSSVTTNLKTTNDKSEKSDKARSNFKKYAVKKVKFSNKEELKDIFNELLNKFVEERKSEQAD